MTKMIRYFIQGMVSSGFNRGSKQLGIPTANFPDDVVSEYDSKLTTGIYYGWSSVDMGEVYEMVMSVGWNPFYHNSKKTMEVHIIHTFDKDFYGALMKVCVLGYIRPEKNFSCVSDLIQAINEDIQEAKERLNTPENLKFKNHEFFSAIPTQSKPVSATNGTNGHVE